MEAKEIPNGIHDLTRGACPPNLRIFRSSLTLPKMHQPSVKATSIGMNGFVKGKSMMEMCRGSARPSGLEKRHRLCVNFSPGCREEYFPFEGRMTEGFDSRRTREMLT